MDFSQALNHIKNGLLLTRENWNGEDMFVFLVQGSKFEVNRPPLLGIFREGTKITYGAHIDMRTADGSVVTWTPTCTDLMAHDWKIVA